MNEELAIAILGGIEFLIEQWRAAKSGTVKASDVLAKITELRGAEAKDDAAAEATLDLRFPK